MLPAVDTFLIRSTKKFQIRFLSFESIGWDEVSKRFNYVPILDLALRGRARGTDLRCRGCGMLRRGLLSPPLNTYGGSNIRHTLMLHSHHTSPHSSQSDRSEPHHEHTTYTPRIAIRAAESLALYSFII